MRSVASEGPVLETKGRLESCQRSSTGASFHVLSGGSTLRVALSDEDVPAWTSTRNAALVGHVYRLDADCPPTGTQVRVTRCGTCEHGSVVAVEAGDAAAFDESRSRLWIVRQFFDRAGGTSNDGMAATIASMVLARYNRRDDGRRSLWIRDQARRALDTYSSKPRAEAMIAKFGSADLRATVDTLTEIYTRNVDRVVLMHGFPYIPLDPRTAPFVGAWGTFASEVYLEASDGTLQRLYPVSKSRGHY